MTRWPPLSRLRRHARLITLATALVLTLAAAVAPPLAGTSDAYRLLAVVDVTGSMNTRDMMSESHEQSRLDAAKAALRQLAARLPCGSRMGLGIFTERRSFLLFEPIDTCADFAPLDGAIAALDWRMAWEGDSYVARGLTSAIDLAGALDADLLFLSDGQEAPPLPHGGLPAFGGEKGKVGGLVVGVGGATPAPIPRFDSFGHEMGFYGPADVPQENRHGPPPEDAVAREGWHPRNAPWGAEAAVGEEHLSAMRADHLRALATATGLTFAPLPAPAALREAVTTAARPRRVPGPRATAPVPAALALLLLSGLYAAPLFLSARHKRTAPP